MAKTDLGTGESYIHDYGAEFTRLHGGRTAEHDAAFFLPYVRPGMCLLDCGCGPGSITVGLAHAVAPARVIAIDIAESQLATARTHAAALGVANIDFQHGSIYELPLGAASVDAVFAHNLIEHLHTPAAALAEVRRVLRPGGVVGIRDDDWSAYLLEPTSPLRRLGIALMLRVAEHNGGNFQAARHHVRLLREAGFMDVAGFASAGGNGTAEAGSVAAGALIRQMQVPDFVAIVLEQGWADQPTLDAIADDFRAWAESPDAFLAFMKCAAIGRQPEA